MSWLAALAFALVFAAAGSAQAEKLTVALSTPEVTINSNFTGTAVTVFGVIDRDARSVSGVGGYDIAVLLLGPRETVVARRKDRILGIWANAAAETFEAAPSFYSLSTSVNTEDLATPPVLERLQLGFDNIAFRYSGRAAANDPAVGPVPRRLHPAQGRRPALPSAGRRRLHRQPDLPHDALPAGKHPGRHLYRRRLPVLRPAPDRPRRRPARVTKTGLEDTLSMFARNNALLYGLICVTLALTIGWLGGVIFRRD